MFKSLGRILTFMAQLVLIAFFAILAREAWKGYEQEKLDDLFEKEAIPVSVRIDRVNNNKLSWKDYISNSKYLNFSYKGKNYTTRYLMDSAWVGEGSSVYLLYYPGMDMFQQKGNLYRTAPKFKTSKLVNWSVLSTFSYVNRWLFGSIVLSMITLLFILSVLRNVTGWSVFGVLSSSLTIAFCLCGASYFTYDAWSNYSYYKQVKAGNIKQLTLLDKSRMSYHSKHSNEIGKIYYYTATVQEKNEPIVVPISENDYVKFSVGDRITLIYNAALDDQMSEDYSFETWKIIFPLITWFILAYLLWKKYHRR